MSILRGEQLLLQDGQKGICWAALGSTTPQPGVCIFSLPPFSLDLPHPGLKDDLQLQAGV